MMIYINIVKVLKLYYYNNYNYIAFKLKLVFRGPRFVVYICVRVFVHIHVRIYVYIYVARLKSSLLVSRAETS